MPRVAVVVPTRNRGHLWSELVECLAGQDWAGPFEVVAVDDASQDDTPRILEVLERRFPALRTVRLPRQRGPATARNRGWRSTDADVVAFTDDDCLPDPGWLRHLVSGLEHLDIVQGRTVIAPGGSPPGAFSTNVEIQQFSHYFQTCNIAYRREVLERLDGFDEAYGFSRGGAPNGEDVDLGWRAVEAGFSCGFEPDAVVGHPFSRSSFRLRLKSRLRSARVVYLVRRHPGMREHFPHWLFFQESHPYALVPLLAAPVAAVLPSIALSVLVILASFGPYVAYRMRRGRLAGRRRHLPVTIPAMWVVDAADILVLAAASLRWTTPVL
ncbi:MAG TPA: glycosyltransferase [Mycobacteriales bacterium]|nr:glycosyltransferase [Mycobacteriales bacterium]